MSENFFIWNIYFYLLAGAERTFPRINIRGFYFIQLWRIPFLFASTAVVGGSWKTFQPETDNWSWLATEVFIVRGFNHFTTTASLKDWGVPFSQPSSLTLLVYIDQVSTRDGLSKLATPHWHKNNNTSESDLHSPRFYTLRTLFFCFRFSLKMEAGWNRVTVKGNRNCLCSSGGRRNLSIRSGNHRAFQLFWCRTAAVYWKLRDRS